jgi:hypothetical protein
MDNFLLGDLNVAALKWLNFLEGDFLKDIFDSLFLSIKSTLDVWHAISTPFLCTDI